MWLLSLEMWECSIAFLPLIIYTFLLPSSVSCPVSPFLFPACVCTAATIVQVLAICSWAHCSIFPWLPNSESTFCPSVSPHLSHRSNYFITLWKPSSLHVNLNSSSLVLNMLTHLSRLISIRSSHTHSVLQPSVSQPWLCSNVAWGVWHSVTFTAYDSIILGRAQAFLF